MYILKRVRFTSWSDLFGFLIENYDFHDKLIIAIDEFQYLVKSNPAVPSIFQKI